MIGTKHVRKTAEEVSSKLAATAENTSNAMIALAVVAVAALAISLIALVVAKKAGTS